MIDFKGQIGSKQASEVIMNSHMKFMLSKTAATCSGKLMSKMETSSLKKCCSGLCLVLPSRKRARLDLNRYLSESTEQDFH